MNKIELEALLERANITISTQKERIKRLELEITNLKTEVRSSRMVYEKMVDNAETEATRQIRLTQEAESAYNEAISMFADLLRELKIE